MGKISRISVTLPGCFRVKGKWVQSPHDRVTVSGELLSPGRFRPSVTLPWEGKALKATMTRESGNLPR